MPIVPVRQVCGQAFSHVSVTSVRPTLKLQHFLSVRVSQNSFRLYTKGYKRWFSQFHKDSMRSLSEISQRCISMNEMPLPLYL